MNPLRWNLCYFLVFDIKQHQPSWTQLNVCNTSIHGRLKPPVRISQLTIVQVQCNLLVLNFERVVEQTWVALGRRQASCHIKLLTPKHHIRWEIETLPLYIVQCIYKHQIAGPLYFQSLIQIDSMQQSKSCIIIYAIQLNWLWTVVIQFFLCLH